MFESLKGILHDGNVDKRVQYMIEVMFAVRKDDFKEHPAIQTGLDLVDEDDQITHLISVEDELDGEDSLREFIFSNIMSTYVMILYLVTHNNDVTINRCLVI